jgi:hypothetical protein
MKKRRFPPPWTIERLPFPDGAATGFRTDMGMTRRCVNHGQNLADDINYSGIVAGAVEGALLGIPSLQ